MEEERHCIDALLLDVRQVGYAQAVLLGMGGSSLAPEVFAHTFGGGPVRLRVLDSTHPTAVESMADSLDLARTLFIVATKSGTTAETLSLFKYFYNRVRDELGEAGAGAHFAAITDAGSALASLGKACNFRAVFLNDPDIGGRYSALSHFGLAPAALVGVNLRRLLRRAREAMNDCGPHVTGSANPGAQIGVVMAEMAKAGRDKLTFIADREVASFADWLEQLLAESTGKAGTGIVPVVGEGIAAPDDYGEDRLFVHLQWSDAGAQDAPVQALIDAGHPLIRVRFRDRYDLGSQFFLWEFASFADWLEQLLAESTGKAGTGIVPVVGEGIAAPDDYGEDRLFVHLQWSDAGAQDAPVQALIDAGHPLIRVRFRDRYDLGSQFFLWEFATAVAGARLGIHPFDQPDVESAKQQSRQMMTAYMEQGGLPEPSPSQEVDGVRVYLDAPDASPSGTPSEALTAFLQRAGAGDYISIQAYLQPCAAVERQLRLMQSRLRKQTGLATTLGFGPRFLHSTGQLHKGDRGNGLFIQLADGPGAELDIPDEPGSSKSSLPFGVLIRSQSLGDRQALLNAGRRVLRIDLGGDAQTQLEQLVESLAPAQA